MRTVIITDDLIDKGGTLFTALWAAGEQFPNARIRSGKGDDEPGGFARRRDREYMSHLEMIFQDFADFSYQGKNKEALAVFKEAENYAKENKVELQPGWHLRKAKIDKAMKKKRKK